MRFVLLMLYKAGWLMIRLGLWLQKENPLGYYLYLNVIIPKSIAW